MPGQTEPNTVITNTATVSAKQTQSVTTTINVVVPNEPPVPPPGQVVLCDLLVKPTKLYRDLPRQPTDLMAVLHLPEGYGKQMIVNQPLILMPGDIPANPQRIFGTTSAGAVMAFFDPQALLAATPVNGCIKVIVSGQLTNGRSFQGQQYIDIYKSSK